MARKEIQALIAANLFSLRTVSTICETRRARIGEAMNPNPDESQPPAPATPQPDEVELKLQNIRETSETLGGFAECVYVEMIHPVATDYPFLKDERVHKRILRFCRPWPEWVLRIAAEVFAVRFPTIPKQSIFDALRSLHFTVLVLRLDGTNWKDAPSAPAVDDKFTGAVFGHLLGHFLRHESTAQTHIAQVPLQSSPGSSVKPAQVAKRTSLEDLQKHFVPMFMDYFKTFPENFLSFQSAFAYAKDGTFDKSANLKETPLTPIYRKILTDWNEIECLSGPKALCEYLSPLLGNQDFEDKYERVKKICQRMEITFLPIVKGQ